MNVSKRFTRGPGQHPSIIAVMDNLIKPGVTPREVTGFGPGIDGATPVGLVDRIIKKLNNATLAVQAAELDDPEYGLYRLVMRFAMMEAKGE